MTVWLLLTCWDHGGEDVEGVFSTEERARAAAAKLDEIKSRGRVSWDGWKILEWEVE